ncbi:MAG: hypothetical protein DRQ46_00570 [Gammaproteobacteria bacterium]|nr:MAG: hypothetical protein DRQ46_00570 [Gammaproteobacteria bacterium]
MSKIKWEMNKTGQPTLTSGQHVYTVTEFAEGKIELHLHLWNKHIFTTAHPSLAAAKISAKRDLKKRVEQAVKLEDIPELNEIYEAEIAKEIDIPQMPMETAKTNSERQARTAVYRCDNIKNGRWYVVKDVETGEVHHESKPSVTTILSAVMPTPPQLVNWQVKQGWNEEQNKAEYRNYMNERAEVGTAVHVAIDRFLADGTIDLDAEPHYFDAEKKKMFLGFIGFMFVHKPQSIQSELTMLHPDLPFAGTADMIAEIDDELWLIDYKTGAENPVQHTIQLNMYKMLYEAMTGQEIKHIACLYINGKNKGHWKSKTKKQSAQYRLKEYEFLPRRQVLQTVKMYNYLTTGDYDKSPEPIPRETIYNLDDARSGAYVDNRV